MPVIASKKIGEFKCSVGAIEQIIGQQTRIVKLRKELRLYAAQEMKHRTKVLNYS